MRCPQKKGCGSSTCKGHFWEGCTAGCAVSRCVSPHKSGHSKDPPSADCLWSLNQSPAAPEIHCPANCGLKVSAGCSSPSCMWLSYWGIDWLSDSHIHVYGPLVSWRSHSQVPESVSLPCPPPERGSVQARECWELKVVSGKSRVALPDPEAQRYLSDWTYWLARGGGTCIWFHMYTSFLEKNRV